MCFVVRFEARVRLAPLWNQQESLTSGLCVGGVREDGDVEIEEREGIVEGVVLLILTKIVFVMGRSE